MTDAVWFAATLLFVLFGFSTRSLDLPARLSIRFATGIVIGGTVMWAESLIGIPWTRTAVWIPMLLGGTATILGRRIPTLHRGAAAVPGRRPPREDARRSTWPIALIAALVAYGAATARITNSDLLYIWAPKGERFFMQRRIDAGFLAFPFHYLMHPDYPPLKPIVDAWSSIAAHAFSYRGALLITALYLLATALALRGFAARAIGDRNANAFATLLAAVLAFGFTAAYVAGGADAQLLMFEVIALAALTFADDATIVAAIALAGAALTKVEGAVFAAAVIVAFAILRRQFRRAAILAIPTVVLLGSWILFAQHNGLLDAYRFGARSLHFDQLRAVLEIGGQQASYRAMYVPWLAAAVPLVFGRSWRRAALPLAVFAASIAYTIFFYLHVPDASYWVLSSAQRVLLTPLACLSVASASASE